jgi:hypothetical protein
MKVPKESPMQSTSSTDRPETEAAELPASDARARLEQRIQFSEAAAWMQDTPLARAFKDVLCTALLQEDVERIRVRCGVARDEDSEGLRFMCKLEYAGDGAASGAAAQPWSWWSPLLEKPEELAAELRRALRGRRDRLQAGSVRERARDGADKARGPSHDTWSTSPWDLGHGVRPDSFCRNRRGRWTGHAAAKPFRPRSPR